MDIIGKTFGKITVLSFKDRRGAKKSKYYECMCACGNVWDVRGTHITHGTIKSCIKCANIKDLVGNTFKHLTVIKFSHMHDTNSYWKCMCVCGKLKVIAGHNLKGGNISSCGCKSNDIREKTCEEKFGHKHPSSLKVIKDKIEKTNIAKYGVKCSLQNKEIMAKSIKTSIAKYGFRYPMQNAEVAYRASMSSNQSTILKHWFSNEDIVCQASYEKATVVYFNKNKIDYLWQVQTFLMPDGRTYRPDCYLPDSNLWVEIKGYFRKDAEEKWNWFKKEYPNSELWNQSVLKAKGIL